MTETDCIQIKQLEVHAHVGVPDKERSSPQRLTFNLTLLPLRSFGDLRNDIDRAVDYASVCAETEKFVKSRRDKLIETMADALARHLLESFALRKITVELRKYVLPQVEFVSVTVTRERST